MEKVFINNQFLKKYHDLESCWTLTLCLYLIGQAIALCVLPTVLMVGHVGAAAAVSVLVIAGAVHLLRTLEKLKKNM